MNDKLNPRAEELNNWFSAMAAVRNGTANVSTTAYQTSPYRRMLNDEEMFYGDVERTGTQLTRNQLEMIEAKYDIPISSKLNYAIVEQVVSFLTGGKPYPRLIGSSENTRSFSQFWEKVFAAWWYEADMNTHYRNTVTQYAALGLGFTEIREDNFYHETTFGITAEHIPWQKVYIDPTCQRRDLSDAEVICICEPMVKMKAEKYFGIKITKDDEDLAASWIDITSGAQDINDPHDTLATYLNATEKGKSKFQRYWMRRFYEQIKTTVYVDENGNVGIKPPRPTMIPNPEKAALAQQLAAMQAQGQEMVKSLEGGQQAAMNAEMDVEQGADPVMAMSAMGEQDAQDQATEQQAQALGQEYQQLAMQYGQMPDEIDAYILETLEGRKVTAREIDKRQEKRIRRTIMLGNRIMEQKVLPIDVFPVVPATMNFYNSFNRTFGLTHYIKDLTKAINKLWAQMVYDMQLNNGRRFLYADGTIVEPTKVEKDFAKPGAWIGYEANPALPDGGRPTPIDGAPLSPAISQAIVLLTQMIEQTTGIGELQQGQVSNATPDTFGGIQTMQTFGTQRIKLYARDLEDYLERLTYVVIQMLQKYMPREKAIMYFDDNGDSQELAIMEDQEDTQFKVRVNIQSNLPTQRAMAAQILGIVSGQTKNPHVADLLTKETLKYLDLPEADKVAEQIDTVKMMGDQLQQMQQQIETLTKEKSQVEQQLMQKDLEMTKAKAAMEIEGAKDLKIQAIELADDAQELAFKGGNVGKDAARVTSDDSIT
jgi:hypothetical protein